MEHLTRYLSWAFVFGAVATLLYTSFKPFWSELLSGEYPPDQISGAMIEASDVPESTDQEPLTDVQVAEALACAENRLSDDVCPKQAP